MELGLKGQAVIVTGGASNIGRGIVLALAAEGTCLTIADLDRPQAEKTAAQAREAGAADARVVDCDVTRQEDVTRLVESTVAAHGNLDVLVNNVGWDQLMYFTQTNPTLWRRLIEVNYLGLLHCTSAVLPHFIEQGYGSIVAIGSDASRQGEPKEAVYGGLKAAVNSFMKSIARENGRYGIRCNVVCPGVTLPEKAEDAGESSMWHRQAEMFSPSQLERVAARLPLKRIGTPRDVAHAVTFLASRQAAGYITGQVLSVSGGYSMIG